MSDITNVEDTDVYPFKSWEIYREALLFSLQTEMYGDKYPKYYKAIEEGEIDDFIIIKNILHTSTPQKILDDIIDMVINIGCRYGGDFINYHSKIIDFLLEEGAKMPWNIILTFPHNESFTDCIIEMENRSKLINMYTEKLKFEIPENILNAEPYNPYTGNEEKVKDPWSSFLKFRYITRSIY
jgi:hypothetical protein